MKSRANSPERVGVFFDIDGTLLPAPSLESRFIAYLLAHDDMGLTEVARWLVNFARQLRSGTRAAWLENKSYLRGLPESLVDIWLRSLLWSERSGERGATHRLMFFTEALSRVEWHAVQRHKIFLLSGTLAPLARVVASQISQRLGCVMETGATELEVQNGLWTGKLMGRHVSREQKYSAIKSWADRYDLSLADSYAYADSVDDLRALESVGHPCAVNADRRLLRHATRRHWPLFRWESIEPDSFSHHSIVAPAEEAR